MYHLKSLKYHDSSMLRNFKTLERKISRFIIRNFTWSALLAEWRRDFQPFYRMNMRSSSIILLNILSNFRRNYLKKFSIFIWSIVSIKSFFKSQLICTVLHLASLENSLVYFMRIRAEKEWKKNDSQELESMKIDIFRRESVLMMLLIKDLILKHIVFYYSKK
jgi:hypothetical protein